MTEDISKNKVHRRGFDPMDERWFSEEAVRVLRIAEEEICWLLNRNYKINPVIEFVGNHYQLSVRQRTALLRACCSDFQLQERRAKELGHNDLWEEQVFIDGFNLVIALEVALSESIVVLGRDGVIRDMAGLRGSYRLIEKTDTALELIFKALKRLKIGKAKFYLDAPVSNSGKLKLQIQKYGEVWSLPVEVELVPNPDVVLMDLERVITGDSVILDSCKSWYNLAGFILAQDIKNAQIVDLRL